MTELEKYKREWNNIVDRLYIESEKEEFKYVFIKHIARDILNYEKKIIKKKRDILATLELTDFHDKQEVQNELEELLNYLSEMIEYLKNFTKLQPITKQGYYNYLKNAIAYL